MKNSENNSSTKSGSKLEKKERRKALGKMTALAGAGAAVALPGEWKKPVINSVLLPSHAATSACPPLIFVDPTATPGSGGQPATCPIAFEIRSSDPALPVTVLSITSAPLGPNDEVTTIPDTFPTEVSATTGIRVTWNGVDENAIFSCINPVVSTNFTITYNCSVNEEVITQVITLAEVVAAAPAVPSN